MRTNNEKLERQIRGLIWFFMIALALSGLTAFPIETELKLILSLAADKQGWLPKWLSTAYMALKDTNDHYPFIAYGSDWLAFAHLVIAVAFVGPLRDPVKNIWVIEFGMIACVMIFPLAFLAGAVRHIPIAWRLIDCSFGVIGLIPLWACHQKIKQLETASNVKREM